MEPKWFRTTHTQRYIFPSHQCGSFSMNKLTFWRGSGSVNHGLSSTFLQLEGLVHREVMVISFDPVATISNSLQVLRWSKVCDWGITIFLRFRTCSMLLSDIKITSWYLKMSRLSFTLFIVRKHANLKSWIPSVRDALPTCWVCNVCVGWKLA